MSQQMMTIGAPAEDGIKPLKTSSTRLRWFGVFAFLFLFVGVGGWLYAASIEGAVIASGSVSVLGKPKTIQHLDGGIVSAINVKNGDLVSEGDILIKLDDKLLKSNLDIYKNRLREAVSRRDRLKSEERGASSIRWDEKPFEDLGIKAGDSYRKGQRKILNARASTRRGQVMQLMEKVDQFNNQIDGLKALKKSKTTQKSILEQELTGLKSLQKDGYASNNRVLSIERQIEDLIGQMAEHDSEVARVKNSISETKIQVSQITREFDESVLTELREVELNIKDMEQQILATQQQLERVEIKAPKAGIIHELGIFTIGGVIGPGGAVMQIVPQDQQMEFEVNLEPQFIDEIYIGQDARVMFSAFNARTTPELNGKINRVSPNTIVNQDTGMAFYLVNVTVSPEELARLKQQELLPGMPVEVFVTTQGRSPLNYLIKPLTDNIRRSLREE